MLYDTDFANAWKLFYLGCYLALLCFFYLTSRIPYVRLRRVLRALAIGLLCTPWYADNDYTRFAPAFVITGLEGAFNHTPWRAGVPLLIVMGVLTLLALLLPVRKKSTPPAPPKPVMRKRREPVMPSHAAR